MAIEREDRIFKGIRFTHLSIFISAGLLLIGVLGIGGKLLTGVTEILVQMKLNTECTSQLAKKVDVLEGNQKSNYNELMTRIDKKQDKHYQYLIPPQE